jgi:hypothetical protein
MINDYFNLKWLTGQGWESVLKYSRFLIFLVREQLVPGGSYFRGLKITYARTVRSKR